MSFNKTDVAKLLVACHRRCCVCHKFCGVKMEIHHVEFKSKGGDDKIENAVPLCFECHAEVIHYSEDHPKGRRFTEVEILEHNRQWLSICKSQPEVLINAPRDRDVGPLEGMLLELEFNSQVVGRVTDGTIPRGKFGCALRSKQYERAIEEGSLIVLSDEVKKFVNEAYFAIGRVNTCTSLYVATRPEGNAFAEASNRLLESLRDSEQPIMVALEKLKEFLDPD